MLNTPITDEDLDFIDTMLEKYGAPEAIFNASELDGFLTAVVSGPDMIMPSEWLPAIWGGEEALPKWESEAEFSRFAQLAMTIMNNIADVLIEQPNDFEAMFMLGEDEDEPIEIVSVWCFGYMRGVNMRPQGWSNLPENIEEQLGFISVFGPTVGESELEHLPAEKIDRLQKKIEPAARALHAYWLSQRAHLSPPGHIPAGVMPNAMPQGQVLPFVRKQPKIGPNQPCPCGSGKKYKKCCGAH